MNDRSSIAKWHKRTSPLEARRGQLYGVCIHTTGVGILDKQPDPVTWVVKYYGSQDECGHYVIAEDGAIHQVAGEDQRACHAGLAKPPNAVELYRSGKWVDLISPGPLKLWREKWPNCKSPLDIIGGRSPNDLYVGIELIPSPDRTFTYVQYFALASLLIEIRERRGLELSGRKLVGHEDLHPLRRWELGGGWDPGALRQQPRFSWQKLHTLIAQGTDGAKA